MRKEIYYILIINLFLLIPSFFYFWDNAILQWGFHLISLCLSRFFLPLLLVYYVWKSKITVKDFFKFYSGLILYLLLCFLYFPTYLGDLRFIDKYDWFTVRAKVIIWSLTFGILITNLIWYKKREK